MRPAEIETSSAGICETRPSPTVSSEYVEIASSIGQARLHHTDEEAADQVDHGDDQAGDRVALHELRGTVHRAVEVGLVADLAAAVAGFVLADRAGVEVGVDRHLLAGHGVEGEAAGHLGDAPGAVAR